MSDNEIIRCAELSLPAALSVQTGDAAQHGVSQQCSASPPLREFAVGSAADTEAAASAPTGNESPWVILREVLKRQLVAVLDNRGVPVPLGRWLAEDLVLAADSTANNTARRACSALGMAETTFRRRLEKVKREFQAGMSARSEDWALVQPVLSRLVAANEASDGENIFERARQVLLEEVVACTQQDSALGSALMGVTVPTYRRWAASLHS